MLISPLFLAAAISSLRVASADGSALVARQGTELPGPLTDPRVTSMLADIPGFGPLPNVTDVVTNATLPVDDIQADILVGMRKKKERFYFFKINNATLFKAGLHNTVVAEITSVKKILTVSTQPQVAVNLAFSQAGLTKLGKTDNLNDTVFSAGQAADANFLGDPGTNGWEPTFVATSSLHGVILLASDTTTLIDTQVAHLEAVWGSSITKLYELQGAIRPGAEEGHEMFGYKDGIAQPAVFGFNLVPYPGQLAVPAGIILTGEAGDTVTRPSWTKDGSFMAFRKLRQYVPEFNNFVVSNAPPVANKTTAESIAIFGSRLVGRWKSGAPIDKTPLVDDPVMAADPYQNNNFDFFHLLSNFTSDQSHCPFAAHIRKTRPRDDLPTGALNTIMRAGIPYGPEPSNSELTNGATTQDRGLAFVAYQSQIAQGFQFLQHSWANTPTFVPGKNVQPGFDPIIGANAGNDRWAVGTDIANPTGNLTFPVFIKSNGGEYFFVPSISAIRDTLSV
nr:dye decolorizing peroxidase [uncultured fungus]